MQVYLATIDEVIESFIRDHLDNIETRYVYVSFGPKMTVEEAKCLQRFTLSGNSNPDRLLSANFFFFQTDDLEEAKDLLPDNGRCLRQVWDVETMEIVHETKPEDPIWVP